MSRNKVSSKIPTKTKDSKSNEKITKKNPSSTLKSDKKTSKSTTGKENTLKKAPKPKTPTPEPQEEYNYEDDFEDYSDDFEDDDEEKEEKKEVEPKSENIKMKEEKPMGSEASRARTPPQSIPITNDESKPEPIEDSDETPMMRRLKSSKGPRAHVQSEVEQKTMNREERFEFNVKASQRQLTLIPSGPIIPMNFGDNGNQEKRHQTLRQLIGIESIPVRILDKPPVKDYNLYLEMFGDSGKIQAYCQTGDDDTNEETQTDERELQNKWTQHPAIDSFGWGADAEMGANEMGILSDDLNLFKINHLQNPRLKEFVEASAQIIIELITSRNRKVEYIEMHHRSDLAFSAGYNLFGLGQLASVSSCQFVLKPPHEDETMLGAFYIDESPATDIVKKSILIEFFLSNSKIPQRVFICEGRVKCCVYAPDGTILFAGLMDGSCVAWDLLEPSTSFTSSIPWPESEDDIILRTPAYDTSFLSSTFSSSSKSASTIHITTINRPNDTTYQVACLDESGTISVWSVLRDVNTMNNLGTRPDARLAMGLTALLRPDHSILNANSNPTFLIANCMVSNRKDPTHFIVGTDIGFLMTLSRTKGPIYTGPRLYKANMNVFGEVICLRNSPFDEDVFVAGLSSGCLSLHRTNHASPLIVLTPPQEARDIVTTIEWSPSHPSILYSVHGGTRVVTWDLGKGQQPVSISKISQINAKVICSHCWFTKPGPASSGIGYMAFGLEDGSVQLHALENVKPIIDSAIKNITQILKKSGAFV